MAKAKIRADCRADNRGGSWAGIPVCVIKSAAYRQLSLYARAILIELVARMNGYNNGSIAASQRELAEALATTNYRTIGKAVAELMEHGLLDVSSEGRWKERQAREYRLTFVTTKGRTATNEYLHWTPLAKSGADDVSAAGPHSADDVSAGTRKAADDVSARIAAHRRKTANSQNRPADDVSSLIDKPYPAADLETDASPAIALVDPLRQSQGVVDPACSCKRCAGPMPPRLRPDATPRKLYCSERCRKAAENARRRAAPRGPAVDQRLQALHASQAQAADRKALG